MQKYDLNKCQTGFFFSQEGCKKNNFHSTDFSGLLHQLMTQMKNDKRFDKDAVFSWRRAYMFVS